MRESVATASGARTVHRGSTRAYPYRSRMSESDATKVSLAAARNAERGPVPPSLQVPILHTRPTG
jgi:hypothetical protein